MNIHFRSNLRWPTAGHSAKLTSGFDPLTLMQLSLPNEAKYVKSKTVA